MEQHLLTSCITSYILSDRKYEDKPLYLPMQEIDHPLIEWAVANGTMEQCPHSSADRYWFTEDGQKIPPNEIPPAKPEECTSIRFLGW